MLPFLENATKVLVIIVQSMYSAAEGVGGGLSVFPAVISKDAENTVMSFSAQCPN